MLRLLEALADSRVTPGDPVLEALGPAALIAKLLQHQTALLRLDDQPVSVQIDDAAGLCGDRVGEISVAGSQFGALDFAAHPAEEAVGASGADPVPEFFGASLGPGELAMDFAVVAEDAGV